MRIRGAWLDIPVPSALCVGPAPQARQGASCRSPSVSVLVRSMEGVGQIRRFAQVGAYFPALGGRMPLFLPGLWFVPFRLWAYGPREIKFNLLYKVQFALIVLVLHCVLLPFGMGVV